MNETVCRSKDASSQCLAGDAQPWGAQCQASVADICHGRTSGGDLGGGSASCLSEGRDICHATCAGLSHVWLNEPQEGGNLFRAGLGLVPDGNL